MSSPETTSANMTSPMVEIDFSQLTLDPSVLMIKEHAFLGYINIRGSSDNIKFTRAIKQVLGLDLPINANTYAEKNGDTLMWLGPNEWLLLTSEDRVQILIEELEAALSGIFAAVNDISGGNTVIELSGKNAQALLLKGCPLDLHESVFTVGQCAQTVIAKTSMILWQVDQAPVYKLIVRRSFADYLGLWLLDAVREYQAD